MARTITRDDKGNGCKKRGAHWYEDFAVRGIAKRFRSVIVGCATKPEAEAYVTLKRGQLLREAQLAAAGVVVEKAAAQITVSDAFRKFWDEGACRQKSAENTKRIASNWVKALGADTLLSAVTGGQVGTYIALRLANGASHGTINRELVVLRAVMTKSRDVWGYQTAKVAIKDLMLTEEEAANRIVARTEEVLTLRALRPEVRNVVRFALGTGLRLDNILSLRWDQVHFTKGGDIGFIDTRVKSRNSKNFRLPLSREATPGLVKIIEAERGKHPTHVFSYVVAIDGAHRKGTRQAFREGGFKYLFNRAVTAALTALYGAEMVDAKWIRFHDLRHTFATRLYEATGNLKLVKEWLAHARIETTERYARCNTATMLAGIAKMAA